MLSIIFFTAVSILPIVILALLIVLVLFAWYLWKKSRPASSPPSSRPSSDYRLAIVGFFFLIIGIVLIANQNSFVYTGYCAPAPSGNTLTFLMAYEAASYFLFLSGIALLAGNLKPVSQVGRVSLGGFTVIVFTGFLLLLSLTSLGVFRGAGFCPSAMIAAPGYLGTAPVLYTNGNLSFTFGQNTGSTLYNVGIACAATTSINGLPNPSTAMVYLSSNGSATSTQAHAPAQGGLNLLSGQTINISGLKCFGASGAPLNNSAIGSAFAGSIWINYTSSSGAPTFQGGSNPMLTVKVATLTTRVTRTA